MAARVSKAVAGIVAATSLASCAPKPLRVGVSFENGWNLRNEMLSEAEQKLVKHVALQTLRTAYAQFDVQFGDLPAADRVITVEDTPYSVYGPGAIVFPFPPAGTTFPVAKVSSIRLDALYSIELAVIHCQAATACAAKTREQLLAGLGRGVGATAAHELGHQTGLHFSGDSRCDDCYDGHSASTQAHFWGTKHWSDDALIVMRRVLASSYAAPATVKLGSD
jgi:hypothetical protein